MHACPPLAEIVTNVVYLSRVTIHVLPPPRGGVPLWRDDTISTVCIVLRVSCIVNIQKYGSKFACILIRFCFGVGAWELPQLMDVAGFKSKQRSARSAQCVRGVRAPAYVV